MRIGRGLVDFAPKDREKIDQGPKRGRSIRSDTFRIGLMATWQQMSDSAPAFTARVRGSGAKVHKTIATLRTDGAPADQRDRDVLRRR